jgi:uncharacterized protein YjbI with pentapeptide repeats
LDDRLEALEAKLLEQEHRPITILRNFLARKQYSPACQTAIKWSLLNLVWPVLFAGGGAAAGAWLTWVTAGTQIVDNYLSFKANELSHQANQIALRQSKLTYAAEQQALGQSGLEPLEDELASVTNGQLPEQLVRKIINFTLRAAPYYAPRHDAQGNLQPGERRSSPEKGRLLQLLAQVRADTSQLMLEADFSFADAQRVDFQRLILAEGVFAHADFRGALLTGVDARFGYFKDCDFRGPATHLDEAILAKANLENAQFNAADLRKADLRNAVLSNADFSDANLEGAVVDSQDWLKRVAQLTPPPKGLSETKWEVERTTEGGNVVFRLRRIP